MKNTPKF